ncbi:hypothetical protein TSOC_007511, partial [Tetrabaena socialis]
KRGPRRHTHLAPAHLFWTRWPHDIELLARFRGLAPPPVWVRLRRAVRRVTPVHKPPAMSSVAAEPPRAFPTTVGFRVQGGFNLPAAQPAPPCTPATSASSRSSAFLTSTQQLSNLSPHPSADKDSDGQLGLRSPALALSLRSAQLASSAPQRKPAGFIELISALSTGAPESPVPVGWHGLLEFSETSGCSGVLGPKPASEDLDALLNRDCKIEICCTAHTTPAVRRLVKSVIRGIRACQEPDKATDGMGGTYFFSNEAGRKAAILKPCDEEPLAPNNPKGYVGRQLGDPGWKPTVRVGEAAIREVAAYLLDHEGWARVPTSVLVRARHPVFCYNASRLGSAGSLPAAPGRSSGSAAATTEEAAEGAEPMLAEATSGSMPASPASQLPMKLGSLQEFVTHECDTSEMGPGRFSVRDVHRIGILDVRLFNTDRHAGNMLVRTSRSASSSSTDLRSRMVPDAPNELIPIDHGFCLPETLEAPYFEWLHWPQTMLPFTEEELQYIRELSVERDTGILRQELPMLRPECLRVLEVCTTLLKTCAAAGLTLFDIASVMTRPFVDSDEEPSELERICAYARQCVEYTQEMSLCDEGGEECESDSEEEALIREELLMEEGIAVPAAPSSARGPPSRGATISSIKEECEDMLFDLEDDASPGAPGLSLRHMRVTPAASTHGQPRRHGRSKRRAAAAGMRDGGRVEDAPESSPEMSPCSSLSTVEHMSLPPVGSVGGSSAMVIGGSSDASLVTPPARLAAGPAAGGAGGDRPVPMASSVHVTDGFLWRKLKSQQAAKRANGGKGGARTCPKRAQAYPPPVAAFSPERMSVCFSGLGEAQWRQFMEVVQDQVQAALASGLWRQSAAELAGGMAASCPRF